MAPACDADLVIRFHFDVNTGTLNPDGLAPLYTRPAAGPRVRGCFLSQGGVSPDACGPRHISPGICILGFLNSEIGLGEAARNLGRACDTARLPTSYVNRPLAKRSNEPAIETFFQRRPDRLVTLRVEGLTLEGYDFDDAGQGRFQVLYPYWELPRIPKGAIAMLDRYDEIWAGSEFIATALRAAVRRGTIERAESGLGVSVRSALRIARALDATVEQLFAGCL